MWHADLLMSLPGTSLSYEDHHKLQREFVIVVTLFALLNGSIEANLCRHRAISCCMRDMSANGCILLVLSQQLVLHASVLITKACQAEFPAL